MEEFLRQYGPIGIFLGSGFEGQTAVIVGGLLARQHILQLWLVLLSATAGSGLVDHLLFVAGRRFRSHRWVVRATQQVAFARALRFIEQFPISYILAFRFIFGLRVASRGGLALLPCDLGILVDINPKPMAGAVSERLAQTTTRKNVACRGVDGKPRPSGTSCANRAIVRGQHSSIDFPNPI
jgi:hypothetical protein